RRTVRPPCAVREISKAVVVAAIPIRRWIRGVVADETASVTVTAAAVADAGTTSEHRLRATFQPRGSTQFRADRNYLNSERQSSCADCDLVAVTSMVRTQGPLHHIRHPRAHRSRSRTCRARRRFA